jgi:hypothetical protein
LDSSKKEGNEHSKDKEVLEINGFFKGHKKPSLSKRLGNKE